MVVVLSSPLGENTRSIVIRSVRRDLFLNQGARHVPEMGQDVTVKPIGREHMEWFHQSWKEGDWKQIGWCGQRTMSLDYW